MSLVKEENNYISALHFDWLTKFYDPIMQWTMREQTFKRQLIQQANIKAGHRVLDLGCGTATLSIMLKEIHPAAEVIGLDGDEKALSIAQRKIADAGLDIELKKGMSFDLDFPNHSLDVVVSSLLFHHLTTEKKLQTFAEIKQALKPDGELHIADWGKPQNFLMRGAFWVVQLLDGFETTGESVQGKLLGYMEQIGFKEVKETKRFATLFGTVCLYRGSLK
ncbi:MAG: class I SAM-dependent methyltransferase [Caldithrix sp.]|nr:class I SAM-dependent methyltransferase [candidate division KSB1 bacterium]TDI84699.1 MAG: class I SAM-dependent methyltransferase [Caldithrix sp.]